MLDNLSFAEPTVLPDDEFVHVAHEAPYSCLYKTKSEIFVISAQ